MLRKTSLLLVVALSCLHLVAQEAHSFTGSLLWKVSGNGLEHPSFILGTHHLTPGTYTDSIAGYQEAFDASQQVIGEILLDDMQEVQQKMMQLIQMPEDVTYADLLTEEEYNGLNEALMKELGAGLDQLGRMKPFVISLSYSGSLYSRLFPEWNIGRSVPMDAVIQQAAKEDGKELLALESVDYQLTILETDPLEVQVKELACSMMHTDYTVESTRLLCDYFFSGNLQGMSEQMNEEDSPCQMSSEMKHRLLKERNDNWLKLLPDMMSEKASLVAVGALHLAGEDGLLYQLSQKGYTVTPIK